MRNLTSVVKGSKKARRDGAAALGLVYRIEIPRFSQGMVNAKAEALEEVMEISAMQKSATPSITSPNIPFQLPGDISLPY
jgi:hypothetical protein